MNVSVFSIGRFHHFDMGRELLRLGHGVTLFTSNPKSKVDGDMRRCAITHPLFRIPFAIGSRLGFSSQLYWLDEMLLRDLGRWLERAVDFEWTDVFHGLDGTGPDAGRRARRSGKLWICDRASTHIVVQKEILDLEHREWKLPPPKFAPDRIERCIAEYEGAHAITVPSGFAKQSFVAQGIHADRVFVCPYGVSLSEFHQDKKKDEVFRVIHVGQINARKGIGYLLRAVEPLVVRRQCELWLVGEIDPAMEEVLRQFRSSFEYKGVCPRRELRKLYSQASVLVLASVEDGLGLVQAQAMACGIPVIATVNTGAEDLFTDGVEGFIVPARSPEAIREKLEWMIANEEACRAMGAAALSRVRKDRGWNKYGELVEAVYRKTAMQYQCEVSEKLDASSCQPGEAGRS